MKNLIILIIAIITFSCTCPYNCDDIREAYKEGYECGMRSKYNDFITVDTIQVPKKDTTICISKQTNISQLKYYIQFDSQSIDIQLKIRSIN